MPKQDQVGNRTYTGFNKRWKEWGEEVDDGYSPDCAWQAQSEPGVVLDPFCGSATTTLTAHRLGRRSIGIDLNPEYQSVMEERLGDVASEVEFVNLDVHPLLKSLKIS